jgi:DNA primase
MIDIFEEIKKSVSITEVCNDYGIQFDRNNKAACPFHKEKSPSFTVYPATNSFNCFGCGVGGTVIDLISQFESISPLEAVKQISADYNIPLPIGDISHEQRQSHIKGINERKAAQSLVNALDEWEQRAFDVLCRAKNQMEADIQQYAPKSEAELNKIHPRFMLAVHWLDYVQHLTDLLMFADFETKLKFYKEHGTEVEQLVGYADNSESGENAGNIRPIIA